MRLLPIAIARLLSPLLLIGCLPSIGDECQVDLDCSQLGDRVCDTSQPGGYCSQFNCDPTSCPEGESICVSYSSTLSPVDGCQDPNRPAPFARNFCMRTCYKQQDCRDGYICLDVSGDNPWSAEVIQKDPPTTMICALPASAALPPGDLLSELPENVCSGVAQSSGEGGAGGAAGAPAR